MNSKIIKSLLLTVGMILLTQSGVFAQAQFSKVEFNREKLTERGKSAYETLLNTEVFTLQGFGAVAAPHRSTAALIDLLKEKEVEKALQSVVRNARNEGKIYALLGLQVIKSKRFVDDLKIYKRISAENEQTEIISSDGGCDPQATHLKQADVIKGLEDGSLAELYILRYFEVEKK